MISSLQNPRIKEAVKLRDRREREETQRFLIEGYRELLRAAEKAVPIETLFYCPELFLGESEEALMERLGGEQLECSPQVFRKISYRDRPDGLLAIAPQRHLNLKDLEKRKTPVYIIAEAIEKPGNLGTILRTADATGVDAVIVCDRCTDIHNPNVVRASVGTLFTVPIVECSGNEVFQWLLDNEVKVVAATPSAENLYTDVDLKGPIAIVMGTEQYGLSSRWMQGAQIQVRIPMRGCADSLNVAMATTVLLYEVLRQRHS